MLEIWARIYYLGRHFLSQPLGFLSLLLAGELAFKKPPVTHCLFLAREQNSWNYISLMPGPNQVHHEIGRLATVQAGLCVL